jgi:hypothetical protein
MRTPNLSLQHLKQASEAHRLDLVNQELMHRLLNAFLNLPGTKHPRFFFDAPDQDGPRKVPTLSASSPTSRHLVPVRPEQKVKPARKRRRDLSQN